MVAVGIIEIPSQAPLDEESFVIEMRGGVRYYSGFKSKGA